MAVVLLGRARRASHGAACAYVRSVSFVMEEHEFGWGGGGYETCALVYAQKSKKQSRGFIFFLFLNNSEKKNEKHVLYNMELYSLYFFCAALQEKNEKSVVWPQKLWSTVIL